MALTHLVDTSVLTRLAKPAVRAAVEPLAVEGRLARAAITDLEIGYSARGTREWDALSRALDVFGLVDVQPRHFQRASAVQRLLAAKGLRGRKVPDLLIAAVAEDHKLEVLHYDGDFDFIARVTGQPTSWVVPAGSVD